VLANITVIGTYPLVRAQNTSGSILEPDTSIEVNLEVDIRNDGKTETTTAHSENASTGSITITNMSASSLDGSFTFTDATAGNVLGNFSLQL
jgi:hypothetical protein